MGRPRKVVPPPYQLELRLDPVRQAFIAGNWPKIGEMLAHYSQLELFDDNTKGVDIARRMEEADAAREDAAQLVPSAVGAQRLDVAGRLVDIAAPLVNPEGSSPAAAMALGHGVHFLLPACFGRGNFEEGVAFMRQVNMSARLFEEVAKMLNLRWGVRRLSPYARAHLTRAHTGRQLGVASALAGIRALPGLCQKAVAAPMRDIGYQVWISGGRLINEARRGLGLETPAGSAFERIVVRVQQTQREWEAGLELTDRRRQTSLVMPDDEFQRLFQGVKDAVPAELLVLN